MRRITCLPVAASVFLLASPAHAQIEWISGAVMTSDFRKTTVPFLQGRTTEYVLKGPWLDHTKTVDGLGSGVTLAKLETGWLDPFRGKATLGLQVSATATPGRRTLTLRKAKGFGQTVGDRIDVLDIYVVRVGTFDARDPTLSNYFNEAGIRVYGAKLGDAVVLTSGWPQGTTATLDASTSGEFAIVRLRFPTLVSQASGDLLFHDSGMPTLCNNLPATYYYKAPSGSSRDRVKITGRNAIKSITYPTGNSVGSGATMTIRLTFFEPIAAGGAVVYWGLTSNQPKPNVLAAEGVAPTVYNPASLFNALNVPGGVTAVDVKVRVCQCLGGVWSVYVRTAFGSADASGPGLQQSSFTVSCPAGGVASCP